MLLTIQFRTAQLPLLSENVKTETYNTNLFFVRVWNLVCHASGGTMQCVWE